MDMCPEFEREEREYQKNVDKWEMVSGTRSEGAKATAKGSPNRTRFLDTWHFPHRPVPGSEGVSSTGSWKRAADAFRR